MGKQRGMRLPKNKQGTPTTPIKRERAPTRPHCGPSTRSPFGHRLSICPFVCLFLRPQAISFFLCASDIGQRPERQRGKPRKAEGNKWRRSARACLAMTLRRHRRQRHAHRQVSATCRPRFTPRSSPVSTARAIYWLCAARRRSLPRPTRSPRRSPGAPSACIGSCLRARRATLSLPPSPRAGAPYANRPSFTPSAEGAWTLCASSLKILRYVAPILFPLGSFPLFFFLLSPAPSRRPGVRKERTSRVARYF